MIISSIARKYFSPFLRLSASSFSTKPEEQFFGKPMTKVFVESISSTVRGFATPNYIVEHDPTLTLEQKSTMKRFLVYKYNPEDLEDKPKYVSYYVDLKKIPPMYLDVLFYIKDNLDPTLSFRRSCREGICGSCSMNCDGIHTLACLKAADTDLSRASYITPLGHMFVLKDLVVDMTNFYTQYRSIEPYLKRKTPKVGNQEYIQTQEDRKKLDGLYDCILCACCSTSCPSYWWNPEGYLGPAVLLQAYRWIVDSRDEYTEERLEFLNQGDRAEDCVNIGMCTVTCPKGLDPQGAIQTIIKMLHSLNKKKADESM